MLEHRMLDAREVGSDQVFEEGGGVDAGRRATCMDDRLRLRREQQLLAVPGVDERLHAQRIARQKQRSIVAIPIAKANMPLKRSTHASPQRPNAASTVSPSERVENGQSSSARSSS